MNIVIACCWPPDGGQGVSAATKELASALCQLGNKITYISPKAGSDSWFKSHGIAARSVGPELSPEDGTRLVCDIVRETNADLVINNDHPFLQNALPRLDCVKVIVCHASAWSTFSLAVHNHEWADYVVAISPYMRKKLLSKGVPPHKVPIILNGIADPFRDSAWAPPQKTADEPLRAVFAGGSTRIKGYDYLLRAFRNAPTDQSWFHLDWFGSASSRVVKEIDRIDWVSYRGQVGHEDFTESLSAADVLLFPSRMEGCPITVIEAMSRGVAPLVSDGHGAMMWMVDNAVDGYVCRLSDWSNDMWGVLSRLDVDRHLLEQIKINARHRYLDQLQSVRCAERIVGLARIPNLDQRTTTDETRHVRWHRPSSLFSEKITLTDRVLYKFGRLRNA